MEISVERRDELLNILTFAETIMLRDLRDYWNVNINLLDLKCIDFVKVLYESGEIRISTEQVSTNFCSLAKSKNFISFLLRGERIPKHIAKKIILVEEFYVLFTSDEILKILYWAEEYIKCSEYFSRNISEFKMLGIAESIKQSCLSKLGNYKQTAALTKNSFDIILSTMRHLWQKGDFFYALDISNDIELNIEELAAVQKCFYLNTKIRIQRDMGEISRTSESLTFFNSLLDVVSIETPKFYNDLKGKYLYNCSINCFIEGDFDKCISYCMDSIPLRTEDYPDPYIKLRIARCFIFKGEANKYRLITKDIDFNKLDSWAKSLYMTVKAEYYRFVLDRPKKAEKFLKQSNELETATGADTVYTDIALLYLYIQQGKKAEIIRYLSTVRKYQQYVDGRLAVLTGEIALNIFEGEQVNVKIDAICHEFKEYPLFLFVSMFSLSKLFEGFDIQFPNIIEQASFGRGFSKKLLSAFSPKYRVLIIYSWWNEYEQEDVANKEWVYNLNLSLRKHGINSFIDHTCSLDTTGDSRELIFSKEYDSFIVVLTAGFKKRVEDERGVLYIEYKELLDLLEFDANRVILVLRGLNDSVSPKEIMYCSKHDLSDIDALNKSEKQILGLVRRIRKFPVYDNKLPLIDEDISSEQLRYK